MNQTTTTEQLLTPKQVAEIIGVSTKTLHKWEIRGDAPSPIRAPGKRPKYRASEVYRWVANGLEWPAPDHITTSRKGA